VFSDVWAAGVKAAYVDLAQIGFGGGGVDHTLRAANLAAMLPGFAAEGARCLVISGDAPSVDVVGGYRAALAGARFTVCRLRVSEAVLRSRVAARGLGSGARLPGDAILGLTGAALERVADSAVRAAYELDRSGVGDVVVETDGLSVAEIAAAVLQRAVIEA
jgi:hypothetical protein